MQLDWLLKNPLSMKKRVIYTSLALALWATVSTTMLSCKKVDQPAIDLTGEVNEASQENYDEANEQLVPAFDDTYQPAGDEQQGSGVSARGVAVRTNLLFDYSAEASNALSAFAPKSLSLWNFAGKCCTHSIQRTNALARSGSYSTRYELRKTDGDVGGSKRAETSRSSKEDLTSTYERWYGASYFLPTDFATDRSPEILTQWHCEKGNPPLALWVKDGKWQIVKFGNQVSIIGTAEKNKWTDFVFHVKWSPGTGGLVEVWKNGVKMYSRTGQSIYTGLRYGVYMKSGIYKWQWKTGTVSTTTKRVVYIDDVRIGSNLAKYSDVAPGN